MVPILCPFLYPCPLPRNFSVPSLRTGCNSPPLGSVRWLVLSKGTSAHIIQRECPNHLSDEACSLLPSATYMRRTCFGQPTGPDGRWKNCGSESSSPGLSLDSTLPHSLSWPEMHEWPQLRLTGSLQLNPV